MVDVDTIFDVAEAIFSVGKGVYNKYNKDAYTESVISAKNNKKNDTLFNFFVNLSMADGELSNKEKEFLKQMLKNFTFKEYASKDIDWCINQARKNPLKMDEVAEVFRKEERKEQLAIYTLGIMLISCDTNIAAAEESILNELAEGLNITKTERRTLIEKLIKGEYTATISESTNLPRNQKAFIIVGAFTLALVLTVLVIYYIKAAEKPTPKSVEMETLSLKNKRYTAKSIAEVSENKTSTIKKITKSKKQNVITSSPTTIVGIWNGYFLTYGKKINFELNITTNAMQSHNTSIIIGNLREDGSYIADIDGNIKGNTISFVKMLSGFEPVEYVGQINNNKIRGKWIIKKTGVSGEWAATKRG